MLLLKLSSTFDGSSTKVRTSITTRRLDTDIPLTVVSHRHNILLVLLLIADETGQV